jgi:hypothetical protein
MRLAARTDANQKQIVEALRKLGYSVEVTSQVGKGFPDIIVGGIHKATGKRANWLLEIKDGSQPPSKRKLTPDEVLWHERWRGIVFVVNSVEEAINILEA